MKAVADAGPIIHLSWLGRLDLLEAVFEEVWIPPTVRDEILAAPSSTPGIAGIIEAIGQGRLRVRPPTRAAASIGSLESGETEAIPLAQEVSVDVLVTDDFDARREAEHLGLTVTGTLGVLRQARDQGVIPAVLPVVELRQRGQWISDRLIDQVRSEETGGTSPV